MKLGNAITPGLAITAVSIASAAEWQVKPVIDRNSPFLFVFDLDSTLVALETIDELAEMAGVQDVVRQITKEAMEGRMDFEQALRKRSKLLKGMNAEDCWKKIRSNLQFNPGAQALVPLFSQQGINYHMAIVSGGFLPIAEDVRRVLGMDYAFANTLETDADGLFTGELINDIMTPQRKRTLLLELAAKHSVPPCNVFAMGDGANDIPMIKEAGVGIAYCAKQVLRDAAQYHIDTPDLTQIIQFLQ